MGPSHSLCYRHSLYPVHAALELQQAEHVLATHLKHYFLEATQIRVTCIQHLNFPLVESSVARVHAKEVRGENGRLTATGSRSDLHYDVAGLVRILWQ